MPITNVYIVRHGARVIDFKKAGMSVTEQKRGCKEPQGDCDLTIDGLRQAYDLFFGYFMNIDRNKTLIISSPYLRAVRTIAPTAVNLGLKVCIEPALQECQIADGWHPNLQGRAVIQALEQVFKEPLNPDSFRARSSGEKDFLASHGPSFSWDSLIDHSYTSCFHFRDRSKCSKSAVDLRYPEYDSTRGYQSVLDRAHLVMPRLLDHISQTRPHIENVIMMSHGGPCIALARVLARNPSLLSKQSAGPLPTATTVHIQLTRSQAPKVDIVDKYLSDDLKNDNIAWEFPILDARHRRSSGISRIIDSPKWTEIKQKVRNSLKGL